jgi:hypothetical protein
LKSRKIVGVAHLTSPNESSVTPLTTSSPIIMASSRQERMRQAMQADLAKLPDLSQLELDPDVTGPVPAQIGPTCKEPEVNVNVNVNHELRGVLEEDSTDSEDDCEIEMIPIIEPSDNKINVIVDNDDCSDDQAEPIAESGPSNRPGSLAKDSLSPIGTSFVPIVPLSKFPYKYIAKEHKEDVANAFFNTAQFWNRSWDL